MKCTKLFFISILIIGQLNNFAFSQIRDVNQLKESLFNGSVKDYADGYYSRALSRVNELIKLDSLNTNALLLKSRIIQLYFNDYSTSLELINKALRYEPDNLVLIKSKVKLLIKSGNWRAALDGLETVVGTKEWDSDLTILLTNICFLSNKPEVIKAEQYALLSFIKENPSIQLYVQLAMLYTKTNIDSSIYYYKKCISLDSTDQNHYYNLAALYFVNNHDKEGDDFLRAGINNCKVCDRLYFLLSQRYLYYHKDITSALFNLEKAIHLNPCEEYIYQRAVINDSIGQKQFAYKDYRFLLSQMPWSLKYLKIISNDEFLNGNFSDAIKIIQNSVEYDKSLADSCANVLMKAYFYQGKYDSAYLYVDKEEIKKQFEFNDVFIRALLLSEKGRYDEGMKLCNEFNNEKLSLDEGQKFYISVLTSLIYLLEKKYDAFYGIADKLYQKDKNLFINSLVFNYITNEQERKRKLVITSKGNSEFVISVNISKKEFDEIRARYKF